MTRLVRELPTPEEMPIVWDKETSADRSIPPWWLHWKRYWSNQRCQTIAESAHISDIRIKRVAKKKYWKTWTSRSWTKIQHKVISVWRVQVGTTTTLRPFPLLRHQSLWVEMARTASIICDNIEREVFSLARPVSKLRRLSWWRMSLLHSHLHNLK